MEGEDCTSKTTKSVSQLEVSELDVTRDVLDVTFVTVSDQESTPIKYYLDMTNWDSKSLGMKINFEDPLQVGKGNDNVMTSLKDTNMFISEASGKAISKDKATSVKAARTQVPKGVKEEDLQT